MHRKWHTCKCKRLLSLSLNTSFSQTFSICFEVARCLHLVKISDSEGRTPLHWAIDRGHLNVAKALVDKKADVNAKVDSKLLKYKICVSLWMT